MKKKIVAFANGWSDDYLLTAMQGISERAKELDTDIFLFIEYASYGAPNQSRQGDINIFSLADLNKYDGILLFGNTLNNAGELKLLIDQIRVTDIPAVCLEYEEDGIACITTDNYSGMKELCDHLFEEHNIKNPLFVSGTRENKENEIRHKAFVDSLYEHGLPYDENRILYGEWSYYIIQQLLPEWMKEHPNDCPDAIICANDVMAQGTIIALARMGYDVPYDILVTGFDNLNSSKAFVPSITTVDRGWSERSAEALQYLVDIIDGKTSGGNIIYHSSLCTGRSCGCNLSQENLRFQSSAGNHLSAVPAERTLIDWHLTAIDDATNASNNLDDLNKNFAEIFTSIGPNGTQGYEGDTFCMCLDESFVAAMLGNGQPRCIGYGDRMEVIFAMRDNKPLPRMKIDTSYIFPVFENPGESGNVYMIAPIHTDGDAIGYVVFKNRVEMLVSNFLYSWIRHMKSGLLRAKKNIEMASMNNRINEMSMIDELSGLLNRKGYEKRAIPLLEQFKKEGKTSVLMVADINKMKLINDKYGHLQGDLAIRLVAKAIMATMPEGWYGVRYGGDEFVILGEKPYYDDGSIIINQLSAAVVKQHDDMFLPFELTISVGSVIIDPNEDVSVDEYFKKADYAMYEVKKALHEERVD